MKKEEVKSKSRKKLYILLGTGAGLLGLTAFGLWWFVWRKGDQKGNEDDLMFKLVNKKDGEQSAGQNQEEPKKPKQEKAPAKAPVQQKTTFPLRRGDRGELVRRVQNNLIERFGPGILPKWGADGVFGKELEDALLSKGFPNVIDKVAFEKIVSGGGTPMTTDNAPPSPKKESVTIEQAVPIATNIWKSCTLRKLPDLLAELKKMNSIKDYNIVNAIFKTIRTRGIRQTIVNAALSSFDDPTSKQMISAQFERMGLKYDGEKWTLSGLDGKQLLTSRATTISSLEGIELDVPADTLLGDKISEYGNKTKFRTIDGQILCVPSQHIRYI